MAFFLQAASGRSTTRLCGQPATLCIQWGCPCHQQPSSIYVQRTTPSKCSPLFVVHAAATLQQHGGKRKPTHAIASTRSKFTSNWESAAATSALFHGCSGDGLPLYGPVCYGYIQPPVPAAEWLYQQSQCAL